MTRWMRRFALWFGWASAAAMLLAQAGCQPVASAPAVQEVDALVARCVDAMTREVCVAQRDSAANSSPAASQVFVAGVGAIDAQAYYEIRSSGEAMCSLVKSRCAGGWNDSACRTARSLWQAPRKT
ncbi:MAG TPA: hypothetical protein VFY73_29925 [Ideonella sp.]|uniref:hypothetical protein n=1 Tax=Ideonella sp. TaxID=1929293 RepID=UPI002E37FFE3|nr:hypothetical protein [Ideonella sp.]HEX5688259.1 hypothetical protein [Ideonella sp.]